MIKNIHFLISFNTYRSLRYILYCTNKYQAIEKVAQYYLENNLSVVS